MKQLEEQTLRFEVRGPVHAVGPEVALVTFGATYSSPSRYRRIGRSDATKSAKAATAKREKITYRA